MKQLQRGGDAPHLLLTMPYGFGDAILVGLSAIDQITRNDPGGNVKIDVLCNHLHAELLEENLRIHRPIQVDKSLFLSKDIYNPKGKNLFDRISPQQVTDDITSLL